MTASTWRKEGQRHGWVRLCALCVCPAVSVLVLGMDACGSGLSEGPETGADARADAANARVEAGTDATNASPDGCVIDPTKYDQSCVTDEDCVPAITAPGFFQPIRYGNLCLPSCGCIGYGAIGRSAIPQYQQDVTNALRNVNPDAATGCFCLGHSFVACCKSNVCSVDCPPLILLPDAAPPPESDAEVIPDGSTLCALHGGPVDGGDAGNDPVRWCTPGEQCTMFNGGWACCTGQGTGGFSTCVAPVGSDGGP